MTADPARVATAHLLLTQLGVTLNDPHGHAIVNTQEMVVGHYCNVVSWSQQLSDLVVNVRWYDGVTHAPTDYDFGVSFHTLTALPPIVIPPVLSGR